MIADIRNRVTNAPPAAATQMIAEASEMEGMLDQFVLTPPELAEKARLLSEGFPDWSKKVSCSFG
jgi:hypothetical protein